MGLQWRWTWSASAPNYGSGYFIPLRDVMAPEGIASRRSNTGSLCPRLALNLYAATGKQLRFCMVAQSNTGSWCKPGGSASNVWQGSSLLYIQAVRKVRGMLNHANCKDTLDVVVVTGNEDDAASLGDLPTLYTQYPDGFVTDTLVTSGGATVYGQTFANPSNLPSAYGVIGGFYESLLADFPFARLVINQNGLWNTTPARLLGSRQWVCIQRRLVRDLQAKYPQRKITLVRGADLFGSNGMQKADKVHHNQTGLDWLADKDAAAITAP